MSGLPPGITRVDPGTTATATAYPQPDPPNPSSSLPPGITRVAPTPAATVAPRVAAPTLPPGISRMLPSTPRPSAPPDPNAQTAALIDKHAAGDMALDRFMRVISGIESSGGRNPATSKAGAVGVMQVMPDTAKQYGFDPSRLSDPDYNIQVAAAIGKDLLARAHGDPVQAAIGYNAGPGLIGTPYASLPQQTRSYVQQAQLGLEHLGKSAYNTAEKFYAEAQARVAASRADPLGAAMNVEQTFARGIAPIVQHGLTKAAFSQAFYDALNPGVEGNRATDALVRKIQQGLKPKDGDPLAKGWFGAKAVAGIDDFMQTFVAQTIADPVSYFPIIGQLGMLARTARLLDAAQVAAKAVGGTSAARPLRSAVTALQDVHAKTLQPVIDNYKQVFGGRPELDPILEPHAKAARLGFEHREIANIARELGEHHAEILKNNETALRNMKDATLPDDVRQAYLQEPWRYGTPEMRQQALERGYQPTEADAPWLRGPEGILHYDLRDDYQFLGNVRSDMSKSPIFSAYGGGSTRAPAFEHEREGDWRGPEADQYDRVRARLNMGRTAIWKRRANQTTEEYIAAHGGWKPEAGPVDAAQLSTGPTRFLSPLRFLGRWGTQAVQGTVLPHAINNVGTLAGLAGGPAALGRAVGYMKKGITPEQADRIRYIGAHAEYTSDPGSVWSRLPISKQLLHGGQKMLSHMEMSYRQGLLDELDRTLGPSRDAAGNVTNMRLEMEKGARIRDAVVDYRNFPLVVAWLEAAGAPFAPFFAGLTHAVARAVVRHPDRVAAVQRGEHDLQTQTGWTLPNPVNTFERLAFDPGRTVAERAGPLPAALGLDAAPGNPHFDRLEQTGAEVARSAGGPWLSQAPGFFNLPYEDRAHPGVHPTPLAGLMQLLFGAYPYNAPSQYRMLEIQRAENKDL